MPVSAALLVTNVPVSGQPGSGSGGQGMPALGPGSGPVRHQQSFARGEKTSSSVRLRKRRDDVTQPGRKINRHSGDFSFFSPRQDEIVVRSVDPYLAYQDPVKLPPNPVLVTMREAPGVNHVKLRTNLATSRAVSASVMNIQEQQHKQQLYAFRKSGDFSLFNDPSHNYGETEDVNARRRPHARSHSQQPIKPGNNNPVPVTEQSKMHQQACVPSTSTPQQYCQVTPGRPTAQALRSATKKEDNNVTKRCSGEFEFKRINRRSGADFHQLQQVLAQELDKAEEQSFVERMVSRELLGDSGSEGSEESGIFSTGSSHESPRKETGRKPGLGRRAITQVNMREKKNSYNHALAKSQENLVKISSDGVAEDVFEPENSSIKKGLLWQQRDKLFSRWKERYFILTKDLLQCFKKETSKITEMGGFIFKIKLSEIEAIELLDKRGYLTICITLTREGKVYLRRADGIRDWFEAIRENMRESRARKNNRTSAIFADRRQNTDSSGIDNWLAQKRLGKLGFSDSTPEVNKIGEKDRITLDELSNLYKNEELEQEETRRRDEESKTKLTKKINRLSLMSDIELPDSRHSSLGIDLEKGIFLRRQQRPAPDTKTQDTDSGNNSLNTNRSNCSTGTSSSSKTSQPVESSFMEEDEDDYAENIKMSPDIRITKPQINKNIIEVRYRERSSTDGHQKIASSGSSQDARRRSQHVNRLQITHV